MEQISAAAHSVWAKYDVSADRSMSLVQHIRDSASVASHLWDNWVPQSVRALIGADLPEKETDGRILVTWLAAGHDLGKSAPAFVCLVPALGEIARSHGLDVPTGRLTTHERRLSRHSVASHLLWRRWLIDHGWEQPVADTYAVVPGGHHGSPPTRQNLLELSEASHLYGDSAAWAAVHDELAAHCVTISGAHERLTDWSDRALSPRTQVLVTAIVIMADWIASNSNLFPYPNTPPDQEQRALGALRRLHLPGPWHAVEPTDTDTLFTERFRLPAGASPHPVQHEALHLARTIDDPGLLIIEAPMGQGKTEAALAAVEEFAFRTGAGGCLIALPTMATSDAMFSRILDWTERLPRRGDSDEALSIYLAHSRKDLNDDFARLRGRGVIGIGIDESDGEKHELRHEVSAHQWLYGRKKGLLADIVVGTIDQVLLGALQSRHLALRHLAFASKIVVIDEAHAYDTYMSVYLDRALTWLGAYRVPTIVLSATLPGQRRRALVEAYDAGRNVGCPVPTQPKATSRPGRGWRRTHAAPTRAHYDDLDGDIGYPVLTASTGGAPLIRVAPHTSKPVDVDVELLDEDPSTMLDRLAELTEAGGCAAVICNTVRRAQDVARQLESRFPGEVTLAHSRFLAVDRSRIEQELLRRFGRDGIHRPTRHFVVGTQVLEQSLDVDFDVMVTDLAPIDLVLQRTGRLHRHSRSVDARPSALRRPRLIVTGVADWSADPVAPIRGSRSVYGQSALLRSAAVLRRHLEHHGPIILPDHIAPLVQEAYASDAGPPSGWETAWKEAELTAERQRNDRINRARDFLLDAPPPTATPIIGLLGHHSQEADDSGKGRAQVRDATDGISVLMVQRVDGHIRVLPWIDEYGGAALDSGIGVPDDLARAVARCTVPLPPDLTHPGIIDRAIADLERNGVAAWQNSPWLGGELVLVLDEKLSAELAGVELLYDRAFGLSAHRPSKEPAP